MSKKILILYTGGTIGMKKTDRGYAPSKEYLRSEVKRISAQYEGDLPEIDLIEHEPLLDSADMTPHDWNRIGKIVYSEYYEYDGFVILHGTDTMAYTASALSFMLGGVNKPIVLTGSQIPLCEVRSDATDNLITSILIASSGKVNEVCLYFGGKLMRGNRATKKSSDGLDAFASPNFPLLAEAGISIRYGDIQSTYDKEEKISYMPYADVPIGVIKVFPGIRFELFEPLLVGSLHGVVLEAFGTGTIPGAEIALLPIIKSAPENGAVVVVLSQCLKGTVSLGAYQTSHALKEAGAVSGHDMTTEAAVTKLGYLLSQNLDRKEIITLMETDLRGELTK